MIVCPIWTRQIHTISQRIVQFVQHFSSYIYDQILWLMLCLQWGWKTWRIYGSGANKIHFVALPAILHKVTEQLDESGIFACRRTWSKKKKYEKSIIIKKGENKGYSTLRLCSFYKFYKLFVKVCCKSKINFCINSTKLVEKMKIIN